MRHQRSTGLFLRLNRLTSIAEDLEVLAVVGLDFGSGFRRRSFAPLTPDDDGFFVVDRSESLGACVPLVDPEDGLVEGGDCETEEGEADDEDARPAASGFETGAFASGDSFGDSAGTCGLGSVDLD